MRAVTKPKRCPCSLRAFQISLRHLLSNHTISYERLSRRFPEHARTLLESAGELLLKAIGPEQQPPAIHLDETDATGLASAWISLNDWVVYGHAKSEATAVQTAQLHLLLVLMDTATPPPTTTEGEPDIVGPIRDLMAPARAGPMTPTTFISPDSFNPNVTMEEINKRHPGAVMVLKDLHVELAEDYTKDPMLGILDFDIEHPWIKYELPPGRMARVKAANRHFGAPGDAPGLLTARSVAMHHLLLLEIDRRMQSLLGHQSSIYAEYRTNRNDNFMVPLQPMESIVNSRYLFQEFAPQLLMASSWPLPFSRTDLHDRPTQFLEAVQIAVPQVEIIARPAVVTAAATSGSPSATAAYRATTVVDSLTLVGDGATSEEAHSTVLYHLALLIVRGDINCETFVPMVRATRERASWGGTRDRALSLSTAAEKSTAAPPPSSTGPAATAATATPAAKTTTAATTGASAASTTSGTSRNSWQEPRSAATGTAGRGGGGRAPGTADSYQPRGSDYDRDRDRLPASRGRQNQGDSAGGHRTWSRSRSRSPWRSARQPPHRGSDENGSSSNSRAPPPTVAPSFPPPPTPPSAAAPLPRTQVILTPSTSDGRSRPPAPPPIAAPGSAFTLDLFGMLESVDQVHRDPDPARAAAGLSSLHVQLASTVHNVEVLCGLLGRAMAAHGVQVDGRLAGMCAQSAGVLASVGSALAANATISSGGTSGSKTSGGSTGSAGVGRAGPVDPRISGGGAGGTHLRAGPTSPFPPPPPPPPHLLQSPGHAYAAPGYAAAAAVAAGSPMDLTTTPFEGYRSPATAANQHHGAH
ncbi:hypothetical protein BC828DRAFT_414781 [Blastocladiella britannica]|nr:hypothetical protein BC828DRAFT_414781 [Blastocladiella britannica]